MGFSKLLLEELPVGLREFLRTSQPAVLAMLGKDEIRLPNPARPDERIVYRTECINRRESRSKPDRGVVTLLDTLNDPRGDPVLTQKVTLLVPRRVG